MKTLIDEHVSQSQTRRAVEALLSHSLKKQAQSDEKDLLGATEEYIWLVLAVKKTQPEKKLKPFAIPLAHPVVDPRTTSICLITKDPQREYKDLIEAKNIKFISRVVGIQKLRGKFKPYEPRRQLMREHGMFLADERVVPLLPTLLGKIFFDAKKQPIPVNLTTKDLKGQLERAVSSTYMHQNQGTCVSIKVATTSHNAKQVLANIISALPAIASRVKGGWDNIQSLHLKTNSSVSLPLWTCSLDDGPGGRWNGLIKDSSESEEEWGGIQTVPDTQSSPEKGRKRSAEPSPDPPKKRKKVVETEVQPASAILKTPATIKAKAKIVVEPQPKIDAEPKQKKSGENESKKTRPKESTNKHSPPVAEKKKDDGKSKDRSKTTPKDDSTPPTESKQKSQPKKSQPKGKDVPATVAMQKGGDGESKSTDATVEGDIPIPPSLTVAELKKKRSGDGLEKKKGKIGKIRNAKDPKAKFIGRGPNT